jgi:hypothetical protein
MTTSLKERLAKQREAVAATGAGADDVIRQRVVPLESARPVEVMPAPPPVAVEVPSTVQATSPLEVATPIEPTAAAAMAVTPHLVAVEASPMVPAPTPVAVIPDAVRPSPLTLVPSSVTPSAVASTPLDSNLTAPNTASSTVLTSPAPRQTAVAAADESALDDMLEVPGTRTQGIPISASDDAIITAMEAHCRRHRIKVRRNSNVSLITRAGWRLLYDLMQRDPQAFAAAIEAGRPPRRLAN